MQRKVEIYIKHVYGNELIYPANETAKLLAILVGKKTFSHDDLKTIQELGFDVVRVMTPSKVG